MQGNTKEQGKCIKFLQDKLFRYGCELERLEYFLQDLIEVDCNTITKEKAQELLKRIDNL